MVGEYIENAPNFTVRESPHPTQFGIFAVLFLIK